jgi:hypothetical protein
MNSVKMPGFTAEASLYKAGVQYPMAATPYGSADNRGVQPQLANDTWTTDKICTACGCSVSGFVCNCGLRPDPAKLACIQNGGPSRVMLPIRTGVGVGGSALSGFRA